MANGTLYSVANSKYIYIYTWLHNNKSIWYDAVAKRTVLCRPCCSRGCWRFWLITLTGEHTIKTCFLCVYTQTNTCTHWHISISSSLFSCRLFSSTAQKRFESRSRVLNNLSNLNFIVHRNTTEKITHKIHYELHQQNSDRFIIYFSSSSLAKNLIHTYTQIVSEFKSASVYLSGKCLCDCLHSTVWFGVSRNV